ncbi:hypothetical protein PENTCL1PPCAC_8977, partial [Pristionchus entomophagus]
KKAECDICGKFFASVSGLAYHKRSHLDDNNLDQVRIKKPFKCDKCEMAFTCAHQRNEHMSVHTGILQFKCDLCNAGFNSEPKQKRHMESHERGTIKHKRKLIKCTFCPLSFTPKFLTKHLKTGHGEKPFENRSM